MNDMMQGLIQMAVGGGDAMGMVRKFLESQNPADPRVAQARRMIFGKSRRKIDLLFQFAVLTQTAPIRHRPGSVRPRPAIHV